MTGIDSTGARSEAIVDRLIASAAQLQHSLEARRDDGDVWIDYLQPQQLMALAQNGVTTEKLALLLNNYEGVVGNPSLSSIWSAAGFRETYDLLRKYVGAADQLVPTPSNPVSAERSPADQAPGKLTPAEQDQSEPTLAAPLDPFEDGKDWESDQEGEESVLLPPKAS